MFLSHPQGISLPYPCMGKKWNSPIMGVMFSCFFLILIVIHPPFFHRRVCIDFGNPEPMAVVPGPHLQLCPCYCCYLKDPLKAGNNRQSDSVHVTSRSNSTWCCHSSPDYEASITVNKVRVQEDVQGGRQGFMD